MIMAAILSMPGPDPGRHARLTAAAALAACLLALRWADPLPLEAMRLQAFDLAAAFCPRPAHPGRVVAVDIDDASLEAAGQWPWPRAAPSSAAIPASTPARELYALTLAGDGKQSVFMREADYVSRLMRDRFGAYGSISLVNHRDHLADRPLATRENLTRVVQALAERSGEEDLIFIYLTSHGSRHHELNLDQPRLQLADLPASELAALLAPLKQRNKVVVISACYSGGFIPPLKDEKTLVMTAARADRVSFGCSEENDFTYFGRALFAEALGETDNLERAFELARERVAEREQSDGFEPSEPQIWAPRGVLQHWRELRQSQAERALGAVAPAAMQGPASSIHSSATPTLQRIRPPSRSSAIPSVSPPRSVAPTRHREPRPRRAVGPARGFADGRSTAPGIRPAALR